MAHTARVGSGVWLLPGCCWERYAGTLPGSAFGESSGRRCGWRPVAVGDSQARPEEAVAAPDPLALRWITGHVARLEEIPADLSS